MSRYGTDATPDRPELEVRVAGAPVEPLVARDVVELDVHEEVGKHARLSLLLQNWDPDARAVRHSDDGPFTPGADVELRLGYHSELSQVFDGVVVSLTAHFPEGGRPVLRVEARSRSILLDHPPRSRQLAQVSDADVASAIASDYGLSADAETGVTRAFVVSDRRTDWELLTDRARALGWTCYVRDRTLVLRPPAEPSEPARLEQGLNVVELQLTEDLTRTVASVTGAGWDVPAAEVVDTQVGARQAGLGTGDRPDHEKALSDAGWPMRDQRLSSPTLGAADQVDAAAVGAERRAALGHVHGRATVVGNPTLRCDSWCEIVGAGSRLSGPHYISAVRHVLGSRGLRTELQLGRPPALVPQPPRPGAGLLVGVVAALADPDGLGRVQVRLPWRGEAGDGVWARAATWSAGDGSGTVWLPDVGQEVLVATLDGEDSQPVVLGALVNGAHTPPVDAADENSVRALVTPDGHELRFADGDSSAVTLRTPAGNELRLAESDSEVTLTHGDSGNRLRLSADGIELSAAQGDVVLSSQAGKVRLDGVQVEGSSTGPMKLASSATAELSASAPLTLKGATVMIN